MCSIVCLSFGRQLAKSKVDDLTWVILVLPFMLVVLFPTVLVYSGGYLAWSG